MTERKGRHCIDSFCRSRCYNAHGKLSWRLPLRREPVVGSCADQGCVIESRLFVRLHKIVPLDSHELRAFTCSSKEASILSGEEEELKVPDAAIKHMLALLM